jgi:hypothetical protein
LVGTAASLARLREICALADGRSGFASSWRHHETRTSIGAIRPKRSLSVSFG